MSLRISLDYKDGYFAINCEERNLAAIFYHTLLLKDNLSKFINLIGCKQEVVENEIGIYFETHPFVTCGVIEIKEMTSKGNSFWIF